MYYSAGTYESFAHPERPEGQIESQLILSVLVWQDYQQLFIL